MNAVRIFSYALLVTGCIFSLSAASTSIGIVRSYGEFKVDGAAVRGNSTLIAGDVVESMVMNTTINLGATEVTMLPESRAALYSDHTTLQRGTTLLRGASTHALEAGNLRVVPSSAQSLVEVGYNDRKLITISTRVGAADVFTTSGELLASLSPGSALAFEPSAGKGAGAPGFGSGQASGSADITIKGELTSSNGKYYVTVGGKTYEITSTTVNLAQYVGKIISLTGSVAGTTVTVASVTVAGVALSAGLITVIAVGAATAGTLGGLAAAGTFSGPSASTK